MLWVFTTVLIRGGRGRWHIHGGQDDVKAEKLSEGVAIGVGMMDKHSRAT